MSKLKFLGRYLELCLDLCQALEHRNASRSYELELKRKIYKQHDSEQSFFCAQMQEHVFDHLSRGPRSWIQHFFYLKKDRFEHQRPDIGPLMFGSDE